MKYSLLFGIALLSCGAAVAQSRLGVEVDKSHNLWWNAPERPTIMYNITDSTGSGQPFTVRLTVTPDIRPDRPLYEADMELRPTGKGKTVAGADFELPVSVPGFYRCVLTDSEGNKLADNVIGYEPTSVISLPDNQPDFDKFWNKAKAELAEVPMSLQLTEVEKGKTRTRYEAKFLSWGGDTITAALFVPNDPGKYPAQVYYNGYGAQPWDMDVDGRPGWVELMTSVRGQFFSQSGNKYGDWIRWHLDDPDTYYYKGAYMDAVRALDVLESLESVDRNLMFAEGGSQGGALTLAAAALGDGRLRAIAPYIPFMSDFKDYFTIVNWPAAPVKEAAAQLNMTDNQMYRNLSYFDIKNFARKITCPVLMGIGLQDPVCPPHTNMSSYTLITSPKELIIYTDCGHTVDYSDWNPRRDVFFGKFMK